MPKERKLPFGWTIEADRWVQNLQEERDELKAENTEQYCEIINLQGENEKLKEEIKNLKRETISREEHQKVCDFLNNEAEIYKAKYVDLIEK